MAAAKGLAFLPSCVCVSSCVFVFMMTGEYRQVFAGYLSSQAKIRQLPKGLGVLRAPCLAIGVRFSQLPVVPNLQGGTCDQPALIFLKLEVSRLGDILQKSVLN